jgi:5-methylcytosine-specific restriction enzyme A
MDSIEHWQALARKFRNTKPWDRCRKEFLAAHPLCEACGARDVRVPSAHVDHHTVPLWQRLRDGEDCFDRLRALCAPCHSVVTRAERAGTTPRLGCDAQGNPVAPGGHWR